MTPTRPSLFHHPVVAVSLLLMAAAAAQIAIWSLQDVLAPAITLPSAVTLSSSSAFLHGWLFERLEHALTHFVHDEARVHTLLFLTGFASGLISGIAWFAAARFAHRPIAAWVVALLWLTHPGVVLLIQRQGALMLMIAFASLCWALLIAWHRYRHYTLAIGAGLACGGMTLISLLGPAFLAVALVGVLLSSRDRRRNAAAAGELLLGWAVLVAPAYHMTLRSDGLEPIVQRIGSHLWASLDSGEKTPVAQDALRWRADHASEGAPRPLDFLAHELKTKPKTLLNWLAHRAWLALYATEKGTLARPLQASQIVILLPAFWAIVISLRHPDRRWLALTGLGLTLATWTAAALAEPLARNLLPAGGIMMLLACVGLADWRERLLRLTDRVSASRAADRHKNASRGG